MESRSSKKTSPSLAVGRSLHRAPRPTAPILIPLPEFRDARGKLGVAQHPATIPFMPKRVFWVADVPAQTRRGGHAHAEQEQVIVAASGRFRVQTECEDGEDDFVLDSSARALYIPCKTWVEIEDWSPHAVMLVLCDSEYEEREYVRDRDALRKLFREPRPDSAS